MGVGGWVSTIYFNYGCTRELFIDNKYNKFYLIKTIYEWRESQPNGYFFRHKNDENPPNLNPKSFRVGKRYRRSPRPGSIPLGSGCLLTFCLLVCRILV